MDIIIYVLLQDTCNVTLAVSDVSRGISWRSVRDVVCVLVCLLTGLCCLAAGPVQPAHVLLCVQRLP